MAVIKADLRGAVGEPIHIAFGEEGRKTGPATLILPGGVRIEVFVTECNDGGRGVVLQLHAPHSFLGHSYASAIPRAVAAATKLRALTREAERSGASVARWLPYKDD